MFDATQMRARFAELKARRDAISAKVDPLHEERAKIRKESSEAEARLAGKIKAASSDLAEIDEEMAMLSRALKGRTAAPVEEG